MRKWLLRKIVTQVTFLYIKGLTKWALRQKGVKYQRENTNDVYTSITGLPFDRFLKFHVERDYSMLFTKPNDVSKYAVQLVKLGEQLTQEFTEACGGDAAEMMLQMTVVKLQSKIYRIEITIDALRTLYDEDLVADLKAMGIRTRITQENLLTDLDNALTEKRKFELELKNAIKRLEDKKPAKREMDIKEEMDEQYNTYYSILNAHDAKVLPKDIDTRMFTVIYNRLKEKAKHGKSGVNK